MEVNEKCLSMEVNGEVCPMDEWRSVLAMEVNEKCLSNGSEWRNV